MAMKLSPDKRPSRDAGLLARRRLTGIHLLMTGLYYLRIVGDSEVIQWASCSLVPGSRHLASNTTVTASAFLVTRLVRLPTKLLRTVTNSTNNCVNEELSR
jgi:hypothetical protein